jgi:hypothetical protein
MTPLVLKYPLDLTGVNPNNLVLGEPHAMVRRKVRAVATNYGPFFTAGLKVYDATNPTVPLIPGDPVNGGQYVAAELYSEATMRAGKEICAIIVITDQTVSDNILLDYQVVGGEFSSSSSVIAELVAALDLDDRPVLWGDILGKPDAFAPTMHLHDIGDIYGFEYLVEAVERVRAAVLMGDIASHDEIYRYIDHFFDQLDAQTNAVLDALNNHKSDMGNPHNTTKTQVGLGLVDNFATANQAQAEAGTANDLFMTPLSVKQAINFIAGTALQAHLANLANPHQVTKAQVGLGNVDNFLTATQAEAVAGTSANRFMTPLGVAQAIAAQAGAALTAHIADTTNPHATTKAQVGLGNVDNFLTANATEQAAGISSTTFMTPAGVKAYADSKVVPLISNHIANVSNPHGTTAAQVGAYSITEMNNLLNQRLPVSGTAVNSNLLQGLNYAQILAGAYAQVGTMGKRNLFISTAAPSAGTGAVGDIWFQY